MANGESGNSQQVGVLTECFGLLRGLYRELFGVFIPGAITTCFFIALPVLTYVAVMGKFEDLKRIILSGFGNVSAAGAGVSVVTSADGNLVHFFLGILFFIVAYAIGGILWRRPIEHADAVAAFRQWCFARPENLERLTVQFDRIKLELHNSILEKANAVHHRLKLACLSRNNARTDEGTSVFKKMRKAFECIVPKLFLWMPDARLDDAKIDLPGAVKELLVAVMSVNGQTSLVRRKLSPYIRELYGIIGLDNLAESEEIDPLVDTAVRVLLNDDTLERRLLNWIDLLRRDLECAKQLRKYEESLKGVARYRGSLQHLIELLADPFWGGGRGEVITRGSFENIIYPYPYLRRYLLARGLRGLARFVGWCGFSSDEESVRGGKNVINLLKYRIRYYGDVDMVKEMDRNECHIRMLNSLWYSFRFVRTMIMFSVVVVVSRYMLKDVSLFLKSCSSELLIFLAVSPLVSAVVGLWIVAERDRIVVQNKKSRRVVFIVSFIACFTACYVFLFMGLSCPPEICVMVRWFVIALLMLGYAVTFCRRNIEKGFHYVREREIIYILTSADILQREARTWKGKNRKIFQDLLHNDDECDLSICKDCQHRVTCLVGHRCAKSGGVVPASWEI